MLQMLHQVNQRVHQPFRKPRVDLAHGHLTRLLARHQVGDLIVLLHGALLQKQSRRDRGPLCQLLVLQRHRRQ